MFGRAKESFINRCCKHSAEPERFSPTAWCYTIMSPNSAIVPLVSMHAVSPESQQILWRREPCSVPLAGCAVWLALADCPGSIDLASKNRRPEFVPRFRWPTPRLLRICQVRFICGRQAVRKSLHASSARTAETNALSLCRLS